MPTNYTYAPIRKHRRVGRYRGPDGRGPRFSSSLVVASSSLAVSSRSSSLTSSSPKLFLPWAVPVHVSRLESACVTPLPLQDAHSPQVPTCLYPSPGATVVGTPVAAAAAAAAAAYAEEPKLPAPPLAQTFPQPFLVRSLEDDLAAAASPEPHQSTNDDKPPENDKPPESDEPPDNPADKKISSQTAHESEHDARRSYAAGRQRSGPNSSSICVVGETEKLTYQKDKKTVGGEKQ